MCRKPFRLGVMEHGCGQCLPCRVNRRRLWTARLMLEREMHEYSWFVTLTYSAEHIPGDGSLSPRDMQLFLKRLRRLLEPVRIRFYGVGEYGDKSNRPHYHLVLFGVPFAAVSAHFENYSKREWRGCKCLICAAWGRGIVHIGDVTADSASYVVSYTLKGMTKVDAEGLNGRHPEFARMSLRPEGIGAPAVRSLVKGLLNESTGELHLASGDVPSVVRREKSKWPLGRYLRAKMREALGMGRRGAFSWDPVSYGVPVAVLEGLGLQKVLEMSEVGARESREERRVQAERNARVRSAISRSKKGGGL